MFVLFEKILHFSESALSDQEKPWYPLLAYAERQTGVKKTYLLSGLIFMLACYLIFGYGAQLLCNTIGFAYPAYESMKAIESPQTRDDTKWLTYWTTYAFFSLLEYPSDLLLFWFPFYWLTKCILLVWLFSPIEYNGSVLIYRKFIRPVFLRHTKEVDSVINKITGQASSVVQEVKGIIKQE